MLDRMILAAVIALFLSCALGSGTALASLKCQCNDGTETFDMNAEFGDDDADASCNEVCSDAGGGKAWKPYENEEAVREAGEGERRRDERGPHRD